MNYFPFHLGDYSAHTGHLDLLEDLAYRRCLDAYYLREGPLPKDASEVARIIRMRDHAPIVRDVLNEFFQLDEEGWRHDRCDQEIGKMQDKQAKARASAQASVNARKAFAQRSLNVRSTDAELPTPTPTPTPTPKKKDKAQDCAPGLFPDGLDVGSWDRWLAYRKSIGRPLKPASWPAAQKAMAGHGAAQAAVVDQSIANGWQGLFALKPGAVTRSHQDGTPMNKQEALEASNRAVVERLLKKEGLL